jgi:hypothetical protein
MQRVLVSLCCTLKSPLLLYTAADLRQPNFMMCKSPSVCASFDGACSQQHLQVCAVAAPSASEWRVVSGASCFCFVLL